MLGNFPGQKSDTLRVLFIIFIDEFFHFESSFELFSYVLITSHLILLLDDATPRVGQRTP
jgi:hypothetical protein